MFVDNELFIIQLDNRGMLLSCHESVDIRSRCNREPITCNNYNMWEMVR